MRKKRLKDRLKKWERCDKLLLVDELPALTSNSSPSDNAPSLRDGIESSTGCFSGLAGGRLFDPLSGVPRGPVLQTFVGSPGSRSGFGPLSSLPFSSADGADGLMSQNNLSLATVLRMSPTSSLPSGRLWFPSKTLVPVFVGRKSNPKATAAMVHKDVKDHAGSHTHSAIFDESPGEHYEEASAKEITEAVQAKISGGGGEDADGRNRRKGAVGEVIRRVKPDSKLTEHEQRLVGRYATPVPYPLTSPVFIPSNPLAGASGQVRPHTHDRICDQSLPRCSLVRYLLRMWARWTSIVWASGDRRVRVVGGLANEAECRMSAVSSSDDIVMMSFQPFYPAIASLT